MSHPVVVWCGVVNVHAPTARRTGKVWLCAWTGESRSIRTHLKVATGLWHQLRNSATNVSRAAARGGPEEAANASLSRLRSSASSEAVRRMRLSVWGGGRGRVCVRERERRVRVVGGEMK